VTRRRVLTLIAVLAVVFAIGYAAAPYARAASLIVRAANIGGRAETVAERFASEVAIEQGHTVPTRYGDVPARLYRPEGGSRRSTLLVPGIHSMGVEEPRLMALAHDLAGSGITVMTIALPDLVHYQITPQSTDVIEDAVKWMASQPDLAPDGLVGMMGISFAGGLSMVAAGRPSIRDRVAFVMSFGGHGDLPRTLKYLVTGEAPQLPGLKIPPPHDYGVAVISYAAADLIVPPDQRQALRDGIGTFLLASQLTLVDMNQANATFEKARQMAKSLPEPSATYLTWVNDRNVKKLGPLLAPHVAAFSSDPAASADRAPSAPAAPVYLLHGSGDTVIPAAESVLLADYLRSKGVDVHLLLSGLITHAEIDKSAAASEMLKLDAFWASILRQ
jgi:dienelactone hydrolase